MVDNTDVFRLVALREELSRLLAVALQHDIEQMAETERVQALHDAEVADMEAALASRDIIGQAKGIIMATMNCSADDAFALLAKQSQHENRTVIEVAAEIADRTRRRDSVSSG